MTARKIIVSFISSFILLSLVITSCSNKDSSPGPDRSSTPSQSANIKTTSVPQASAGLPTPSKPDARTTAATGNIIKLKTVSFIDEQGTRTEAFNLLVPSDWQYEGGVQWLLDNPTMPAISHFRIWNPKGTEQFEVFPSQAFFWSDNPRPLNYSLRVQNIMATKSDLWKPRPRP